MVKKLFVLYEHAAGYALFKVQEYEEIAMFLPQVEKATLDSVKFKAFVNLIAFFPFKSGTNALDNINSISEGIVHEDIQAFLETNLPQKKSKIILGVADAKIGAALQESLGYQCQFTDVVPEVLRGIRFHFHELVQGLTLSSLGSAECSLGRSYSRAKVKFNVNRADNMVIQSISLIDQLDKDINVFSMRLKEWYSYHFPELAKIITDNNTYSKAAQIIRDRKEFTMDEEEARSKLENIIQDSSKIQAIISAAKSSMGMDISPIDLVNIEYFASKVISLAEYRKQLMEYLISRMHNIAPNLAELLGEIVGARLLSHAGSLTNLAKFPSSTIQLLGAEKALFRAIKQKGKTPKYGLIYHSTFIGKANAKNKGKISRFLANKCSIASRIDCFADDSTNVFGQKLKEQVENRLKFLESGEVPQKNLDVMTEAMMEAAIDIKKRKKKLRKEKKRKLAEMRENSAIDMNGNQDDPEQVNGDVSIKKKKKKARTEENADDDVGMSSFVAQAL